MPVLASVVRNVNLRFAAADPGGANVIAAFLHGAPELAPLAEPVWTLPVSASRFAERGIAARCFSQDRCEPEAAKAWADQPRPSALVTGTSMGVQLEAILWRLAEADAVPTLAWLDQWTNLECRFQAGRPGWVAAIDTEQRGDLMALGFKADRVLIAGQPYLSFLGAPAESKFEDKPLPSTVRALLYVSEPYSRDYALGLQDSIGFDEFDVFDVIYETATQALEISRDLRIDLAIKLHPYEGADPYCRRLTELSRQPRLNLRLIGGDKSGQEAVGSSDIVVGVSSILLLEAMLLGKPTLSLRPGLIGPDPFAPSRYGNCLYANDNEGVAALLTSALLDPEVSARALKCQEKFLKRISFDGRAEVSRWLREHQNPVLLA